MVNSPHRTNVNRSAILAQLGAHGSTSRADLARALGLSPALITQVVKQLLAEDLIVELEQAPSNGGRPARLLGLATSAGHAIGVKVAADHVALVEVGIDGHVVRAAESSFDAGASTFASDLADAVRAFLNAGSAVKLLGVGVAVPGTVDEPGNGIVDCGVLQWNGVHLGDALRRSLGLPVVIENDVNALAVAERLFGVGKGHENFLVVTIGAGIGAGIVVEGSVLRAASGGAGEIGHIPVTDDGPRCSCGNDGCLEALIGERALVDRARRSGVLHDGQGITDLLAAAVAGDSGARALYRDAGRLLGRTLAGVVHIVDPAFIVVLGEGSAAWPFWADGFEGAFRSHLPRHRRTIPVDVEAWLDDRWAQGAAALVLATPFDAGTKTGDQGRLIRDRFVAQAARA